MTTSTLERPSPVAFKGNGGAPARRAVVRWALRLFRREWRQQVLVLALIVVAVGATIVGSAVATNTPPPAASGFGTAQDMATFAGNDPRLAAEIAALEHRFGTVAVIETKTLQVPGSIDTYEVRAQDPNGPYGPVGLALVSGHYPTGPGEVAVTAGLASDLGLHVGGTFDVGGATRQVSGIVENPQSLLDEFALLAPGQLTDPDQVVVLFDAPGVPPGSIGERCSACGQYGGPGSNVTTAASVASTNPINPETISLVVLTIGMLLIALVAVGGFTVLAQRRRRSFGMLAAIGATDRNIALVVRANGIAVGVVGAVVGTVLGLVLWLAYRPSLEQSSHHLIGVFALPWAVVGGAIVLAVLATYVAASRPARSLTHLSVVAALSGRPESPKQLHRSALPGIVFLVAAFLLLGYAGGTDGGSGGGGTPELLLGIVALIPAIILLAPSLLVVIGRLARRAPVALRLALRDLARYRARSGSALAAVSLGVMIAVMIATLAQVRYADVWDPAGPNLAANEANLSFASANPTASQVRTADASAQRVGEALGAQHVVPIQQAALNLQNTSGSKQFDSPIDVATPQLLQALGIRASQIDQSADLVTALPGFAGASGLALTWCEDAVSAGKGNFSCPKPGLLRDPVVQGLGALPSGVHAPNTLVTERTLHALGIANQNSDNGWFVVAAEPITAAELHNAQLIAATAGLSIETKNDQPTSSTVVNWATVFGIVIALCILAMSVGLIRSEAASDLRTLAATGASSSTHRTLSGATAGALGLLGAVLGTFAGYVGVIGFLRGNSLHGGLSSLGDVPVANLLVILVGLPLLAAVVGFALAGREPPAIARQPIE